MSSSLLHNLYIKGNDHGARQFDCQLPAHPVNGDTWNYAQVWAVERVEGFSGPGDLTGSGDGFKQYRRLGRGEALFTFQTAYTAYGGSETYETFFWDTVSAAPGALGGSSALYRNTMAYVPLRNVNAFICSYPSGSDLIDDIFPYGMWWLYLKGESDPILIAATGYRFSDSSRVNYIGSRHYRNQWEEPQLLFYNYCGILDPAGGWTTYNGQMHGHSGWWHANYIPASHVEAIFPYELDPTASETSEGVEQVDPGTGSGSPSMDPPP